MKNRIIEKIRSLLNMGPAELRFMQFIINFISFLGNDCYYMEDEDVLNKLDEFAKKPIEQRPAVYAVRIYLKDFHQPMADLALGEGGRPNGKIVTIHWDNINERNLYYFSAYTLIWDEREVVKNKTFEDFLKQ